MVEKLRKKWEEAGKTKRIAILFVSGLVSLPFLKYAFALVTNSLMLSVVFALIFTVFLGKLIFHYRNSTPEFIGWLEIGFALVLAVLAVYTSGGSAIIASISICSAAFFFALGLERLKMPQEDSKARIEEIRRPGRE